MSGFEFIFTLYGLLLGFSLVELLGGLARTLEARLRPTSPAAPPLHVGWLTPMLGVFVMLDLISFWWSAWVIRDLLTVSPATLLSGLLFAGVYYLAAHLVFPREPAEHADLDLHYFRVKRWVLLAMLALLGVQLGFYMSVPSLAALFGNPIVLALTGSLILFMLAALAGEGEAINAAALAALIGRYLVTYLI